MTDNQEAPREPWDEEDEETETSTGPEWWEAAGKSDEERERLRKAYELGRAHIIDPKSDATAKLQAMYDAAPQDERQRLRNAFAAGQQIEYKKLSDNQRRAKGPRTLYESECVAISKPPCFLHLPTGDIITDKGFTKKYGYLSKSKTALSRANNSKAIARYHAVTFQPPKNISDPVRRVIPVRIIDENGLPMMVEYYNTYRANPMQPLDEAPHVFLNHLRYLVPNARERIMLGDWLADLIQHPGRKRMFAILLVGPGGTGKSWVADLMRIIIGYWNASNPRNKTLASEFNGWICEKTLGIIHELKGTGVTAENLQDVITQPTVPINKKGIEIIEMPNHISLFLISNHEDCLPMTDETRRYLVIQCAKVPYGAIDKPSDGPDGRLPYTRTPEFYRYYDRLFSESEGQPTEADGEIYPTPTDEARRVLGWLMRRKIYPENPDALNCRSVAPPTKAKGKVVEAGRSSIDSLTSRAFRHREPPFNGDVFSPYDVLADIDPGKDLPGAERTHARVTTELRKLHCEPIRGDDSVRTALGRRVLWALNETDAKRLAKLAPKELALIYLRARKAAVRDEEQAERDAQADARADESDADKAHEAKREPDIS